MTHRWWYLMGVCAISTSLGVALAAHQRHDSVGSAILPAMANPAPASLVRELTSMNDLTRLTQQHPQGVLLDFHAQWCAPCQQLAPRLESLARDRPLLVVAAIDAATFPKLADAFNVDTLPTLVHLVHGQEVARKVGAPSAAELAAWLDATSAAATPAPGAATATAAAGQR